MNAKVSQTGARLDLRIDDACRRHAKARAVTDAHATLTYSALGERAAELSAALQNAGLERDEPVIVAMSNHAGDFASLLGVWRAGGVAVPVHRRASSATVAGLLSRTGARLIVNVCPQEGLAGLDTAIEEVQRLHDTPPPRRELLEDAAWIVFTSGSTGSPKGVVQAHDTYLAKLDAIHEAMALAPQRVLLPLQPTFAYAQWVALTTLLQGGEVLITNPFDPERFVDHLDESISAMAVVPTMLRKLRPLIEGGRLGAFAGVVVSGGEPLPAELGLFIRRHWPEAGLWDIYGLTETATSDFYVKPDAYDSLAGSIGHPAPGVEFRLSLKDSELQIRTPFLMRGYLDDPELTHASLSDGYFRTGDQARLRVDGAVEITGRLSDMVNRAGTKIAPLEVERVFSGHPDVADVLATGVPHAETGEALHVAVVLQNKADVTPDALWTWAGGRMDRHKLPDAVHIVETLPTGATGKADRNALRSALVARENEEA